MVFQMLWLRKLIRRHTNPIPEARATQWKNRLSIAYAIVAWNAFGIVCYACYKGKADWATYHGIEKDTDTPAQQWTKTLGIKNATVYRVSGFNVHKYEVHNDFDKDKYVKEKNDGQVVEAGV